MIRAELPGVKLEDVDITLQNGVLTISGEHKVEQEEERGGYHVRERRYGSFRRSMTLPEGTDEITARDRELLTLLAAGMKDREIACTMGVTERTVGRRVTELMERLDAVTRFRAGVRAAHRGWIIPTE